MKKSVYITTTLPYVNDDPHVGFAMEIIRADVLTRYHKLLGNEVFFNTGTDEHGQKLYDKAKEAGEEVQAYVDRFAVRFRDLQVILNLDPELHFIRTTDAHHVAAAQEFWKRVSDNGYIYKKNYQAKYCVGCELEKTDSELVDGRCPEHPNKDIEIHNEENYFFKWSAFEKPLLEMYDSRPDFVIPDFRFNEIKAFVSRGLQDFSISRLANKMPWGVPVPGDSEHVMYVWFDALVNYISTLGWPDEAPESNFQKFWVQGTTIQYCGKNNLRQQSAMWQAMLLAAGIPNSRHIIIDGFINSGGQKMSKSLGNVINPYNLVKDYEAVAGDLAPDVLRYYLLRHMNPFEDSDMTLETVKEAYTAGLANGLGNLVSRIMTLSEKHCDPIVNISNTEMSDISDFNFQKSMDSIWEDIAKLDVMIAEQKPFSVIKEDEKKGKKMINDLVVKLASIANGLKPFLPKTSEKITALILANKKPETPLFNRLS